MDREIRSFEVRQVEDEFVEGYAAVFSSRSELLGNFYEEIEPGAFDGVLDDDVFALLNHDPNFILARTKNGTLQLSQDEVGLKVRFQLPRTSLGNDMREMLKSGLIDRMSFAFTVKTDKWSKVDGTPLRTIMKVERLYDVSPVVQPAYKETSISVQARSMALELAEASEDKNDVMLKHQVRERQLKLFGY